jgi:hypothetical protein
MRSSWRDIISPFTTAAILLTVFSAAHAVPQNRESRQNARNFLPTANTGCPPEVKVDLVALDNRFPAVMQCSKTSGRTKKTLARVSAACNKKRGPFLHYSYNTVNLLLFYPALRSREKGL